MTVKEYETLRRLVLSHKDIHKRLGRGFVEDIEFVKAVIGHTIVALNDAGKLK